MGFFIKELKLMENFEVGKWSLFLYFSDLWMWCFNCGGIGYGKWDCKSFKKNVVIGVFCLECGKKGYIIV